MNLQDRLKQYIKSKNMTFKDFENLCELSNGTAARLRDTTRNSTFDRIANKCDLNINWLKTGEGEMIKRQDVKKEVMKSEKFVPDEFVKVRSIDISPTASFTDFEQIPPQDYDYTYIMREPGEEISGDDIVFTIHGDSMEKQIFDHDKVLGKFIRKSQWHWAKGIVIMAYDDSFVIKRILDNRLDQDNYILLGSDNPSFPQTVKVPLSSIRVMFKADRVVSRPLH